MGGVMGSLPEGYPELLSSVKPSIGESAMVDEQADRLEVSLCHPKVCRGRRPLALDDRFECGPSWWGGGEAPPCVRLGSCTKLFQYEREWE